MFQSAEGADGDPIDLKWQMYPQQKPGDDDEDREGRGVSGEKQEGGMYNNIIEKAEGGRAVYIHHWKRQPTVGTPLENGGKGKESWRVSQVLLKKKKNLEVNLSWYTNSFGRD